MNNLLNEPRNSLRKPKEPTENRSALICRAGKGGKIVILYYEDCSALIIKELQQFKMMDFPVDRCGVYFYQNRINLTIFFLLNSVQLVINCN